VADAGQRTRPETLRQVMVTLAISTLALAVCCALIASSDLKTGKSSLMQVRFDTCVCTFVYLRVRVVAARVCAARVFLLVTWLQYILYLA
jgi:hypothetical protein